MTGIVSCWESRTFGADPGVADALMDRLRQKQFRGSGRGLPHGFRSTGSFEQISGVKRLRLSLSK